MAIVFIVGMPRSGTTWLAKLFDAHPEVLYRHEPDSVAQSPGLPNLILREEWGQHREQASAHFHRLLSTSTLKTEGVRPWFRKAYRGSIAEQVRRGICASLRAAEGIDPVRAWARRQAIPDLIPARERERVHPVIKSVVAWGRVGLYADALPKVRFVILLRHPCGFVASQLRGKSLKALAGVDKVPVQAMCRTEAARRRGLDSAVLNGLPLLEKLTWEWVLFNEKMIEETEGRENCLIVRYEDVCADPAGELENLYGFCGLEMVPQTRSFLEMSSKGATDTARYYSLFRDPHKAAARWRSELSEEQIECVRRIAQDAGPGRFYFPG